MSNISYALIFDGFQITDLHPIALRVASIYIGSVCVKDE